MIQQAFIDMENMFDLMKEKQEVSSAVCIVSHIAICFRLSHNYKCTLDVSAFSRHFQTQSLMSDRCFTVARLWLWNSLFSENSLAGHKHWTFSAVAEDASILLGCGAL